MECLTSTTIGPQTKCGWCGLRNNDCLQAKGSWSIKASRGSVLARCGMLP